MQTLINIAKLLLAWILFGFFLVLLLRFTFWFERRIFSGHVQRLVGRDHVGVLSIFRRQILTLISGLIKLGALFLALVQLSVLLSYSFSLFELTKDVSVTLLGAMGEAAQSVISGIMGYLPALAFVAVLAVIAIYLNKLLRVFFKAVEQGDLNFEGFYPDWAEPTYELVRFLLYVLTLVVAFPYLPGSQSGALQGVSIFFGVLFSFGSTAAVSNLVAGVVLTYMRPFQIGDRIRIGDTIGDVIQRNLLVTRLRTIKNEEITMPNGTVLGGQITNYSAEAKTSGLILHTTITIGYDAPWRTVHELLIAAAKATPGLLSEPAPFVFQTALNDFNVSYEINAYTDRPAEFHIIYSELHANIQEKFNQGGVEIMSPNYFALRDGNTVTIPEPERVPGYRTPGFRVDLGKNA